LVEHTLGKGEVTSSNLVVGFLLGIGEQGLEISNLPCLIMSIAAAIIFDFYALIISNLKSQISNLKSQISNL
jgi:hypothetical protein